MHLGYWIIIGLILLVYILCAFLSHYYHDNNRLKLKYKTELCGSRDILKNAEKEKAKYSELLGSYSFVSRTLSELTNLYCNVVLGETFSKHQLCSIRESLTLDRHRMIEMGEPDNWIDAKRVLIDKVSGMIK